MTWGSEKKQSFGNKSGKPQPIRTKFSIHAQIKGDNVREILGAIGQVGGEIGGSDESCGTRLFVVKIRRLFGKF